MFINLVKNMVIIKKDKLAKNNLYICFKGKAFYWWNSVLSPKQKRLIKHGENVEKWEQALLKRWKKIPSTVMVTIKYNQYTMEDARRKREPIEFALAITRAVKATNMPVSNQITLIYTGIKLKFRRDFSKPTEKIIMDSCLQELKNLRISGE